MQIKKIDEEVLKLVLHASKSSHPNEFAGILRSSEDIITEVLLLPGTFSSDRSALMRLDMLPLSSKACGSVHSHPTPNMNPSEADLNFFSRFGKIHLIIAHPYSQKSWKAFDSRGEIVSLKLSKSEKNEKLSSEFDGDFWL